MSDHRAPGPPDVATLLDWLEGRLEGPRAAAVEAAVTRGDDRLRGLVSWLQTFVHTADSAQLQEVPPIVHQRLRAHFAQWRNDRDMPDRAPTELWARSFYDSRDSPVLTGVRGTDTSDRYHLALATDLADLVLDVETLGPGQLRLEGQVLLADPGLGRVFEATATAPGVRLRTVDGDDLGRFRLAPLPASRLELDVTNGELLIHAHVDLRAGS